MKFKVNQNRFASQVTCVSGIHNENKQRNEKTSRKKATHPKTLFLEFSSKNRLFLGERASQTAAR